jgi:hypothetical protein
MGDVIRPSSSRHQAVVLCKLDYLAQVYRVFGHARPRKTDPHMRGRAAFGWVLSVLRQRQNY